MAKEGKDPNQLVPVVLPLGGIDTAHAFSNQPPGTTPSVLNCRPEDPRTGRRRLSRRRGQDKFLDDPLCDAPVQDIISVIVDIDQQAQSGDVMSIGSTGTTLNIWDDAGSVTFTSGSQGGTQSLGCIDDEQHWYVATVETGGANLRLEKFHKDTGASQWNETHALTGSGTGPKLWGLCAFQGKIYVWLIDVTVPGIYRFSTDDGSACDPSTWISPSTGLVTATATAVRAYQCMATGTGQIGVVGAKNGNLVHQIILISNGQIVHENTIQNPLVSYESRLVANTFGTYFLLTNAAGAAVNHLVQIGVEGGLGFDLTSTTKTATDICPDNANFAVCVVGAAIFKNQTGANADDSYHQYSAVTGVLFGKGKPGTITQWDTVCSDGLEDVRARRSVASGSTDLISFDGDSVATVWSAKTNLGVSSEFLWLQCTGYLQAPRDTAMKPTRVTQLLGTCGGGLHLFNRAGFTTLDDNFVTAAAPVVWSTFINQVVIFADGVSYKTYDPFTQVTGGLTPSAGTVPADSAGRVCPLIQAWRGRLVFAGLGQNWFMSAVDDHTDFDYSLSPPTSTMAINGTVAASGNCPDRVTSLAVTLDDRLIFGCDHSIWEMVGDPADGGRFNLVTNITGMAFGRPYTMDPEGNFYFIGNRGVAYVWPRSGLPTPISGPISDQLASVDLTTNLCRMAWDDEKEGFHLFITPFERGSETMHYWWDRDGRTTGWWPDQFQNTAHNPMAIWVFDGDDPEDRVLLLGGADGYVRYFDDDTSDDDGTPIVSSALCGPIEGPKGLAFRLGDLQATLGYNSADVTFGVQPGESHEAAAYNASVHDGVFSSGRNRSQAVAVRAHAIYVTVGSEDSDLPWTIDSLNAVVRVLPPGVAQRAFYPSTIADPPPRLPGQQPVPTPPTVPVPPDPGTPWDPSLGIDPAPFRLWIYADDSSISGLNDGDPVTTDWTNRGGAGGVMEDDGGVGTAPTFQTNELNGLPIIRFDGFDDRLQASVLASEFWTSTTCSTFMIAKANPVVASNQKGFWGDAAAFRNLTQRITPAIAEFQNWDNTLPTLNDSAQAAVTNGAWTLYTGYHASGVLSLSINGGTPGTTTSGPTQFVGGKFYVGTWNGLGYMEFDLAELIIHNEFIDTAERQIVEGYLCHKWGLTSLLPSTHPYKNTAPTIP